MPERIYVQVGMVLTALSSVAIFVYSMIYLLLFSMVQWDPASFAGIWGLGAAYTVFAIAFGVSAATLGIIATVFIHVRAGYNLNLMMILTIVLAGIIQINPAAIPVSAAAFVFISLSQELFGPQRVVETLPKVVPEIGKGSEAARPKTRPSSKPQPKTKG